MKGATFAHDERSSEGATLLTMASGLHAGQAGQRSLTTCPAGVAARAQREPGGECAARAGTLGRAAARAPSRARRRLCRDDASPEWTCHWVARGGRSRTKPGGTRMVAVQKSRGDRA